MKKLLFGSKQAPRYKKTCLMKCTHGKEYQDMWGFDELIDLTYKRYKIKFKS